MARIIFHGVILLFCETWGIEEITLQPCERIVQVLADITPLIDERF